MIEELKFKKLNYTVKGEEGKDIEKESEAILPVRANNTDAGLDLFCTRLTQETDNSGKLVLVYHTDLAVEIPEGYFGALFMKSSVAKRSISLTNAVGVIDSGYRGEIMAKFKVTTDSVPTIYSPKEPFIQLVIIPCITPKPILVDELTTTARGDKGFGENTKEYLNKETKND